MLDGRRRSFGRFKGSNRTVQSSKWTVRIKGGRSDGFGRLGEWFGSHYYDIEPDLIIFAKAVNSGYLPLGGVLVGDRVAKQDQARFQKIIGAGLNFLVENPTHRRALDVINGALLLLWSVKTADQAFRISIAFLALASLPVYAQMSACA